MIANSLDSPSEAKRPDLDMVSGSIDVSAAPAPAMKITLDTTLMREFLEEIEVSPEERAAIEAAIDEPSVPLSEVLKRR